MDGCAALGCTNRSEKGIRMFGFPKEADRRIEWLTRVGRSNLSIKGKLCAEHFERGQFKKSIRGHVGLRADAVPTLFLHCREPRRTDPAVRSPTEIPLQGDPLTTDHTYCTTVNFGDELLQDMSIPLPNISSQQRSPQHINLEPAEENIPVPKKANDEPHQSPRQLQAEHGYLQQELENQDENQMLKEELEKSRFSYATVKCNARLLLFFTGLTSVIYQWLLTKIYNSVERISQKLGQEDHLLVVLMKLRLGLSNTDLAYRFNESTATISDICRSWIPTMAIILRPLIKWPSREAIRRNMPDIFDPNFTKCRCIMDFAEISIARPSNLTARAQTWSTYKHNNTMKYLVAFTPAGAISFLSPGWGGQVSERQITYDSGFLGRLEPRDQIIAERGFQIRSELAAQGATFRIPHFARRKKQLSAHELETSRQLSRVTIHVERVLGRWKDFKILQSVIPLSQVDMLDDVVVLCSALTNLCKSVVPKRKQ
ncbi:uncharacterized protein LOC105928197 isoform X2 [Fundulus heteroclitus]|uniref:uncharacterized protein LOC105928197 isoform X2 n=1 Tax=Fundulus heteroclitus TaxID=8078 RepID=UPI00165A9E1D|nr:uncharacterized protein LOC105928197 isoform X2 [Fundulus heteroclitus]XP_035997776.1 uncharacterized protein LOC105928197 isoform X2 [Fundulus heteroclitus]